jgi:hypothetical protein
MFSSTEATKHGAYLLFDDGKKWRHASRITLFDHVHAPENITHVPTVE